MSRRVYISEISAISAMGMGYTKIAAGLKTAPVISSVKDFEFHQFAEPVACFLVQEFDAVTVLGKKGLRNKDNATKCLLGTLESSPLKDIMDNASEKSRPGLCVGTAFGSVQSIGDFLSDSIVNGVSNVNPQAFANTVINSPTGNANIRFIARNLSATIATGFNAGLDALIYSADYIRSGYLDSIVAGGLEEVSYYSLLGMQRSAILSLSGAVLPFGVTADGCMAGEGCALFLLETQDPMDARGAKAIGEIVGYASTFDPTVVDGIGTDNGAAAAQAIRIALEQAHLSAGDIGFVASSANGNARTDKLEAQGLGAAGITAPVTAYKSFTGECYGASGALNAACALSDLQNQTISGVSTSYPTIDSVALAFGSSAKACEHAMVTSFSCEGNCSVVIIKKV